MCLVHEGGVIDKEAKQAEEVLEPGSQEYEMGVREARRKRMAAGLGSMRHDTVFANEDAPDHGQRGGLLEQDAALVRDGGLSMRWVRFKIDGGYCWVLVWRWWSWRMCVRDLG